MSGAAPRLVGLGCMRLSTDPDRRDEHHAIATIHAGLDAGVTLLDTARSYGRDEADAGHNERLVAQALGSWDGDAGRIVIVTKGGLVRDGEIWRPDGRASTLLRSCEASLEATGRDPLDVFLLHAPDPGVPLATSVRALARIERDGLARRIGLANVSLPQLREALEIAPITVVELPLGVAHDAAFRDGLVRFCVDRGILVVAHSPLGGVRRAAALAKRKGQPRRDDVAAGTLALAWLYDLDPLIVPIPGARRPETAREAGRAATIELSLEERAAFDSLYPAAARVFRPVPMERPRVDGEVVLIMGIQGAGKTRAVVDWVARGHERLNRDERGGTLRGLAEALGERLDAGVRHVVLDNTYLTRASRNRVLEAAHARGLPARCVWLDTPLEQAQVNAVERLLARYGELPDPERLRVLAKEDPGAFAPTVQLRAVKELEPPDTDEGFATVERVVFVRDRSGSRAGLVLALDALPRDIDPGLPTLVTGWSTELPPVVPGADVALCAHGGGPPRCWCRPPLPGLVLAWARRHDVDVTQTTIVGGGAAFRTMARTLGARRSEEVG